MPRKKVGVDLISRRSFLGALGTFAAAAPFSLWPMQAHALYNMGAFWKKRRSSSQSLRFNATASACLNRTPSTPGNRQTWTFSCWLKRGNLAADQYLFSAGTNTDYHRLYIHASSQIQFEYYGNGYILTQSVFRDPSAWYHVVAVWDTTNTEEADRARLYVNGQRITTFSSSNPFTANVNGKINSTASHSIASATWAPGAANLDGYLAEVYFIDGQALDASSFGQTDAITGQWIPKKYSGSYGTNGFYLPFNDATSTTALGYDRQVSLADSGKNNWSLSGLQTHDQVLDSPTNNFCTLSPLDHPTSNQTLALANLDTTLSYGGNFRSTRATMLVNTGKWYWETTITAVGLNSVVGILGQNSSLDNYLGATPNSYGYYINGQIATNGSAASGYGSSYTTGDVIGVALDLDSGTLAFYTNGTSPGVAFSGVSGLYSPSASHVSGAGSSQFRFNFGQGGQAGLTYDSASGGRFKYTPPAGFKALCTANLSTPAIKNPSQHFNIISYTGTGVNRGVTGIGFSPDLVWIKDRDQGAGYHHFLHDKVRGVPNYISTDTSEQEYTTANTFQSFDSDGFSVSTTPGWNDLNHRFVAWCWKKGATPGFDIVTYTGNGAASRNISHGLGVAPAFAIVKRRDSTSNWWVYNQSLSGANYYLLLNGTAAQTTGNSPWNVGVWNSTVFQVAANAENANALNGTYIAHLWAEVAGFSKFGSYTGNGNADGPFVYCGFKPRWLLVKRSDSTGSWIMLDAVRDSGNPLARYLVPNLSDGEVISGVPPYDLLSNGFKVRATVPAWNELNASGGTYIFAAFAEAPFKYATAR